MKKPKILMVGPFPPQIGGITFVMLNILNSNLKNNYDFIPFSTTRRLKKNAKNNQRYNALLSSGIPRLISGVFITLQHMFSFPFIIFSAQPKIIHIHASSYMGFFEGSYYLLLSKLFHKKTILHIHGGGFNKFYADGDKMIKAIIIYSLKRSDKIIALNSETKSLIDSLGIKNCSIMLNCIDTNINIDKKRDDKPNVLFLGGAESEIKGVFDVLKALPLVIKANPNVHFFIGSINKKVENICKNKFKKNVTFFKFITGKEKEKIFSKCNILIMPTYAEASPIIILEAAVHKMAVITTPVGGIPEVIKNNVNGFFIKPGDYKALADKIILLSKNKKLRDKLIFNAFKKVKKEFNMDVFAEKIRKVYGEMV